MKTSVRVLFRYESPWKKDEETQVNLGLHMLPSFNSCVTLVKLLHLSELHLLECFHIVIVRVSEIMYVKLLALSLYTDGPLVIITSFVSLEEDSNLYVQVLFFPWMLFLHLSLAAGRIFPVSSPGFLLVQSPNILSLMISLFILYPVLLPIYLTHHSTLRHIMPSSSCFQSSVECSHPREGSFVQMGLKGNTWG